MKSTAIIVSLISAVLADGVTDSIAPSGSYPSGCIKDYTGDFELSVSVVTNAKRDLKAIKVSLSHLWGCGTSHRTAVHFLSSPISQTNTTR